LKPLFVREISEEELSKLEEMSKDWSSGYRAQIVLLSHKGMRPSEIASTLRKDRRTCRKWIRRFNEGGIQGLASPKKQGRPKVFNDELREEIRRIAARSPREFGVDADRWSLRKLAAYLSEEAHLVKSISREQLRRILAGY
jgi:transposase